VAADHPHGICTAEMRNPGYGANCVLVEPLFTDTGQIL